MHMIDRQTLADVFEPGGSAPADMYVALSDPAYHLAEQSGFAKYRYDPVRAARLMADAGWTLGSDGMLANSAGHHFEMQTRVIANTAESVPRGVALAASSSEVASTPRCMSSQATRSTA